MPRAAVLSLEEIRSIARSHTLTMINVLVGVARQKDAPPAARVVAANSLLDRGWGKPDQVHSSPDGGPIQVVIRHIVENTIENEPVLIEHEDRDR